LNTSQFTVSPNPYSQKAYLKLQVHEQEDIEINVFDATGKWLKKITDATYQKGSYVVEVGENLPAGTCL